MRIFKTDLIRRQLDDQELQQLEDDFYRYKDTDIPASTFGRDALYDHPHTLPSVRQAQLRHLHLISLGRTNKKNQPQYYRTSDDHLIYCEGFYNQQDYLLITILSPNAHASARKNSLMFNLAGIAENFRDKY